jgi:DNA-binding transcriptional LysR family regulator
MAGIDLNLLRVFVSIFETASLTASARELHVTQPSVSHALSRLRKHFDDPLFQRGRSGMQPTALAAELYESFQEALARIDQTVDSTRRFDPLTSTRRFRICLTDVGEMNLLPRILEHIAAAAPSVELEVVPMQIERVAEWLTDGHVDAAITSTPVPGGVRSTPLMVDTYACLVRRDFPLVDGRMTTAAFLAGRHAVVAASSGHLLAEQAMAELHLDRKTTVMVHHFSVLPHIVDRCDLIAIIPRGAGDPIVDHWPLTVVDLPFAVSPYEVRLYWQARDRETAAQLWFRHTVEHVLRDPVAFPAPVG